MGWFGGSDRVRQLFEDQFEPDGSGYIYRKNMKGEPVKVTASERDAFIKDFARTMRIGMLLVVIGTILLIVLLAATGLDPDKTTGQIGVYGGIAAMLLLFMIFHFRAWNRPARALQDRVSLGHARTREEARDAFIRRTSYGQYATYSALSVALFWRYAGTHDVLHGWPRIAPVLLALILGAFGWRVFQKWQLERGDRP